MGRPLHLNFSYHVEHHLYPTSGYKTFPAIRAALERRYPDKYVALSWGAAVRLLFSCPLAVKDANTLAHPTGRGATPVPFPVETATPGGWPVEMPQPDLNALTATKTAMKA